MLRLSSIGAVVTFFLCLLVAGCQPELDEQLTIVTPSNAASPSPNSKIITKVPTLLGLGSDEVSGRLGRLPDGSSGSTKKTWTYCRVGSKGRDLMLQFDGEKKLVKAIWALDPVKSEAALATPVRPDQLIPADVWSHKPTGIYVSTLGMDNTNSIVIYWRIGENNFFAEVFNSQQPVIEYAVITRQDGLTTSMPVLTNSGKNFRSCDRIVKYGYSSGRPPKIEGTFRDPRPRGSFFCSYVYIGFMEF